MQHQGFRPPKNAKKPPRKQPAQPAAGWPPNNAPPQPYGAPQQPYAAPQQPYVAPQQPYGAPPPNNAPRGGKPRRRLRWGWLAAAALVLALAVGAVALLTSDLYADYMDYQQAGGVFLQNTHVDGVALGGMTYDEAWNTVTSRVEEWRRSWSLQLSFEGFTYATVTYDTLGIGADYEEINALLDAAWRYGHGDFRQYRSDIELLSQTPYQGFTSRSESQTGQLDYILSVIAGSVYRAPSDARIVLFDANRDAPFVFENESDGRSMDIPKAREDILRMASTGQGGSYEVAVTRVPPAVRRAELEKTVALLTTATTAIDKSSTAQRNDNIRLAFGRINGTVLRDGEKFSFNKAVGKRSIANGFQVALGYTYGELEEVVGGGICQCSSTLYQAALCAGLTINTRTPHSMPVSYMSLGQDATVNDTRGHEIDLAFTNNTGYPVYLTARLEQTSAGRYQCVVRVYGQSPGDNVFYRLQSTETRTIPAPTEDIIRKDTEGKYVTYVDEKYKLANAREGHVVETRLQRVENGAVTSERLITTDTYKEKAAIYYVGVNERY